MAPTKRKVLAIVAAIVVLGAVVLALALTRFETGPVEAPNSPVNSTVPTQTPSSTCPPTLPPTSSQATSVNGSFELTISVENTVYTVGEPVNVTLAITNIGSQTVDFTHTGMDFDFIVTNGTDNLIYQWSIGQAFPMFTVIEPLQPGENVTATYTWPQTCNSNPSTVGSLVSPGTYYIVGKSNSIYGLQTNPLQITIVSS